jgi:hypothetical protein
MSEDALHHIELMPLTKSQVDLPQVVDFILLSGDIVYTSTDRTLYVFSVR